MKINHLDLFSGIGGFALGLKNAGFEIGEHYYSEIDKHAIAIYKHQFKEAKYAGSVTDVRAGDLPRIDCITFGSPCQDFSLAGKRAGIEGERSGLIGEALRLIDECRPKFFVWENVKGVYSSNAGADFWAIIQAFADIGGYRLEWQLLNTSWFLPQNRERLYLVGYSGAGSRRAIFPIGQSPGNNAQARQQPERGVSVNCIDANYSKGPDGKRTMIRVGQINSSQDGQVFSPDGVSQCLSAGHGNVPKIAVDAMRGRNPENSSDRTPGAPTQQRLEINENGTSNTLTSVYKDNLVVERERIRRLTEVECERLQGFPDQWTKFGDYDGVIKPVPATQRYKALGNAVTVDVVKAVAESIIETMRSK